MTFDPNVPRRLPPRRPARTRRERVRELHRRDIRRLGERDAAERFKGSLWRPLARVVGRRAGLVGALLFPERLGGDDVGTALELRRRFGVPVPLVDIPAPDELSPPAVVEVPWDAPVPDVSRRGRTTRFRLPLVAEVVPVVEPVPLERGPVVAPGAAPIAHPRVRVDRAEAAGEDEVVGGSIERGPQARLTAQLEFDEGQGRLVVPEVMLRHGQDGRGAGPGNDKKRRSQVMYKAFLRFLNRSWGAVDEVFDLFEAIAWNVYVYDGKVPLAVLTDEPERLLAAVRDGDVSVDWEGVAVDLAIMEATDRLIGRLSMAERKAVQRFGQVYQLQQLSSLMPRKTWSVENGL